MEMGLGQLQGDGTAGCSYKELGYGLVWVIKFKCIAGNGQVDMVTGYNVFEL